MSSEVASKICRAHYFRWRVKTWLSGVCYRFGKGLTEQPSSRIDMPTFSIVTSTLMRNLTYNLKTREAAWTERRNSRNIDDADQDIKEVKTVKTPSSS